MMDAMKKAQSIYYGNLRDAALKISPEQRQQILDVLRYEGGSANGLSEKFMVPVEAVSGIMTFNIIEKNGFKCFSEKDLVGDTVEGQLPWYY